MAKITLDMIDYAESHNISIADFLNIYKAELNNTSRASKIYIIRHCPTDFNGDGERIRGIVDIALTEDGLIIANDTAISLLDSGIECIYSSDMTRTLQTSRAIQLNIGAKIEQYPGFRAWNLGSLAGKKTASIQDIMNKLIEQPDTLPPGSKESFNSFKLRNIKAFNDAIQFNGTIAIVSHYSNCRFLLEYLGQDRVELDPGEAYLVR